MSKDEITERSGERTTGREYNGEYRVSSNKRVDGVAAFADGIEQESLEFCCRWCERCDWVIFSLLIAPSALISL